MKLIAIACAAMLALCASACTKPSPRNCTAEAPCGDGRAPAEPERRDQH